MNEQWGNNMDREKMKYLETTPVSAPNRTRTGLRSNLGLQNYPKSSLSKDKSLITSWRSCYALV